MGRYFKNSVLFLTDLHVPFTDMELLHTIIYELCKDINFKKIILGGDFLDCYSLSRFPGERPERAEDFHYEITCGLEILKLLRSKFKKDIIFIQGNHEARIKKILNSKFKQFRNIPSLKLEELLDLNKYNIKYHDHVYKLNKNFICTHGFKTAMHSSRAELQYWGISGCSGHVHRYNTSSQNGLITSSRWYSFGTLADINLLTYAKDFRLRWDNSFGIIEYDEEGFNVIPIIPDTKGFYCQMNGKYYEKNKHKG